MKHIYLFNEICQAAAYGIGTYISQVIACLSTQKEISLTVVSLLTKTKMMTVEYKDQVRYISIPQYKQGYHLEDEKKMDRFYTSVTYLLTPYISIEEDNIFHFNYSKCRTLVKLLKEKYPLSKSLCTIHYLLWSFYLDGNTSYFRKVINKKSEDLLDDNEKNAHKGFQLEKQLFQSIDHVICLADYTYKLLSTDYGVPENKLNLIYNGIFDDSLLLTAEEQHIKKKKFHIDEDSKIILYVGRLDPAKGVGYLIDAFKQVLLIIPNAYLVIIGDGNYSHYLSETDESCFRIIFTGKLCKDRLYEFYELADIGVLLSFNEQCSYVAIEMMMHGIPLVTTNSTGLSEMVEPELNGCKLALKEEGANVRLSVEECKEQIIYVLQKNKELWQKECRKLFKDRYHLEIMNQKLLSLYFDL